MSLISCTKIRRDPKNAAVFCWLSRISHAVEMVSWKTTVLPHVRHQPPQLPTLTHKSSRIVVQPACPTLRGRRGAAGEWGMPSTSAFVLLRDAETLAHRQPAGTARGVSNRSASKLPIRFETNLVPLVCIIGAKECMNDARTVSLG